MLAHERHRLLLRRLEETGALEARGLGAELGVAAMTIWRDLRMLERQGLLKRVHGGAIRADRAQEPEFRQKEGRALAEKRRIASTAARLFVRPGDVILLEGGTTVAELLPHIPPRGLTLMTNSLPILSRAQALGRGWQIHCSGGVLSPVSGNFVGPEAVRFFHGKYAATFFMSATGLDPKTGALTDPNPVEIEVKRAMARAAQRVVLLLDSRKIGLRSVQEVIPLCDVDTLVIDCGISATDRRTIARRGPRVRVC
ncbi:MAG TPA: DeoR/GlpR family DNA-binding transcription regulator [Verrucomicrobiae bacterium]|nr:DeoR/GlpR family DNA-binding transcription regulator [Verrucomicrobiae bacterium]